MVSTPSWPRVQVMLLNHNLWTASRPQPHQNYTYIMVIPTEKSTDSIKT